jgi:hypothetical protein
MNKPAQKPTNTRLAKPKSVNARAKGRSRRAAEASTARAPGPMRARESKQARVLAMLQSPDGVSVAGMMEATGWQPHSVRGFLSGVVRKRLGLQLSSTTAEGDRVYRVESGGESALGGATPGRD